MSMKTHVSIRDRAVGRSENENLRLLNAARDEEVGAWIEAATKAENSARAGFLLGIEFARQNMKGAAK